MSQQSYIKELKMEPPKKVQNTSALEDKMKSMEKDDLTMVKGKFIFHEAPGCILTFSQRKYRSEPVRTYTLRDGEIYTVPKYVAKYINNQCVVPTHSYILDANGNPTIAPKRGTQRFSFQSSDFFE